MKIFRFALTVMALILPSNLNARPQIIDNCEEFLAELREMDLSASSVDTAPRVLEKNETENYFSFVIEKHSREKITLKLPKSKTGREIFEHISFKDILIKEHGSTQIRTYKIGNAGGLLGKNFDRICS